jgi:hypothetical protein
MKPEALSPQKPTTEQNGILLVYWVGNLFYNAFSVTELYDVDDRVTSERWRIGKDLVGRGGLISCHLPGGTEENHKKPQSGHLIAGIGT